MQRSRYTQLFGSPRSQVLFNARTAAVAVLEPADADAVLRLLADPGSAASEQEQGWLAALIDNGFLVDEVDEPALLRTESRRIRFGRRQLGLTMAPTMACNFGCDYCYAQRTAARMTPEVEAAVLAFAERELGRAEQVWTGWIGGEPTLAVDVIERLQAGLRELAERRGVQLLPAGLASNGFLLDRAVARRLVEAGIRQVQITLDGPREVHDQRRHLVGGGPTFDRILDNLGQIADLLPCALRVNVDERNLATAEGLLDELAARGLLGRIPLHFAPVTPLGAACANLGPVCRTQEEHARWLVELNRSLAVRSEELVETPTLAGGAGCSAEVDGTFVIGPDGRLYKCWESIGDQTQAIGSIFREATPQERSVEARYLARDPWDDPTCRSCDLLPLCLGGCPLEALRGQRDCCSWKYNLAELLELRAVAGVLSAQSTSAEDAL